MPTTKTIAVHGATGRQGAPIAAQLARSGYAVRSLSRATGADLTDRASLAAAYAGADAVVLQFPLVYDERALAMAETRGQPYDVDSVTASFGPWLIAHGDLHEAGDVIGRVAPWAAHDYDAALLQVRLFHALGQPGPWSKALVEARGLAGERAIPNDVRDAPRAGEVAAAAR
jgi:uncharacterized protein YbjT (DUF2867 family)